MRKGMYNGRWNGCTNQDNNWYFHVGSDSFTIFDIKVVPLSNDDDAKLDLTADHKSMPVSCFNLSLLMSDVPTAEVLWVLIV
mmetsp:Transcript_9738/g.18292  ORF Transcript_9738/g.18292 Transcript_9738/m.18292 type:complete len:82 (-) Transcript_9738:3276-3521(-)